MKARALPARVRFRLAAAVLFVLAASFGAAQAPDTDRDERDRPQRKNGPPAWQRTEPKWLLSPIEAPHVRYATFESKAAGEKVSYLIYLPPAYDASPEVLLPVVYWLHGIGGSQLGVPRFCERLTQAIDAGKCPPIAVVFVNGMIDSFYCDAINVKRPVETVIMQELIPHIDATYRTLATREGRMIEGFSMGGFGAARLGFKYPDQFGSISIIDGALLGLEMMTRRHTVQFERIFNNSEELFLAEAPPALTEKNAAKVKGRTAVRIVTRTAGLVSANESYHELLDRLGIEHEFHTIPDAPHSPNPLYEGLGDRNWSFYSKAFSATSPAKP